MIHLNPKTSRIVISDNFESMETKFYLVDYSDLMHPRCIGYDGDNLISVEIKETERLDQPKIKPLLKVPLMMKETFIHLLINAATENNIKTKNEFTIEGELTATRLHLQDMKVVTEKLFELIKKK